MRHISLPGVQGYVSGKKRSPAALEFHPVSFG